MPDKHEIMVWFWLQWQKIGSYFYQKKKTIIAYLHLVKLNILLLDNLTIIILITCCYYQHFLWRSSRFSAHHDVINNFGMNSEINWELCTFHVEWEETRLTLFLCTIWGTPSPVFGFGVFPSGGREAPEPTASRSSWSRPGGRLWPPRYNVS